MEGQNVTGHNAGKQFTQPKMNSYRPPHTGANMHYLADMRQSPGSSRITNPSQNIIHVQQQFGAVPFPVQETIGGPTQGHLEHPPSSVYYQALSSVMQSPSSYSDVPHHFVAEGSTQRTTFPFSPVPTCVPLPAPVFMSPPQPMSSPNLTDLMPVTPSRISDSLHSICEHSSKPAPAAQPQIPTIHHPFKSPPLPLRLRAADGSELRPRISKTNDGKIVITYPLDMLANSSAIVEGGANSSYKIPQSVSSPQSSFTKFLNFPVPTSATFNQFSSPSTSKQTRHDPNTPSSSVEIRISDGKELVGTKQESGNEMEVAEVVQSSQNFTYEKNTNVARTPVGVMAKASHPRHTGVDRNDTVETSNEVATSENEENEEEAEERQSVQNITQALNIQCDVYKETKKKRADMRMHNRLPKETQGLMGEANLCYARGDHDDAIKMCMEIIRVAPYCPDPFETLAMIYEEREENTKALQYSLLAAHLQQGDVDTWVRLAENCEEAGLLPQAVHCYNKAIKLKPDDYKVCWAAAVLQQQLGNLRQALVLFKSVVKLLPETEVKQCIALARDIARACHANNETTLAMEVMEEVATKHFDHVKYEDVNVICELALSSGQYRKVFDILVKHCQLKVQYESEDGSEEELRLTHVEFADRIPIDLRCKCILASIHLGCFAAIKDIFEEICGMDPAQIGDLQFDVAEALIEVKDYRQALYVLDILVRSTEYSLAAVWLKKGECHRDLHEDIEEMKSLREVVALAPGHTKAYLALCLVLRKLGKYREAVEVIEEAETYEMEGEEQMLVSYERFKAYREWASVSKKRHEKLCKAADAALLMLASKLEAAFILAKTILVKRSKRGGKRYHGDLRLSRRVGNGYYKYQNKKSLSAKGLLTALSNDEWWTLHKTTIDLLLETERYRDGITLVDAALSFASWHSVPEKRISLERSAVALCMIGGNYSLAYSFIRPWLLQQPKNNQLWNLFNQITIRSQDQRHHRFCLRFLVKEPENMALAVLTGHNSLATGTYKHSLGEYMRAHKQIPTEPMFMLLLGIIYTHIASQRFTSHKNSLTVQGLAFLNMYQKHRKCDQESFYNMGRALHQLGLVHFAVHWYQKALNAPLPQADIDRTIIDLKCEIAYNLALIYRKSGNLGLANQMIEEYCVI